MTGDFILGVIYASVATNLLWGLIYLRMKPRISDRTDD